MRTTTDRREEFVLAVGPASPPTGGAGAPAPGPSGWSPGPVLTAAEGSRVVVRALVPDGRLVTLFEARRAPPGTYLYRATAPAETPSPPTDLHGLLVVAPRDDGYWPPADTQRFLVLDEPASARGRGGAGAEPLADGSTAWRTDVAVGEIVRLHLANAARAHVFRLRLPGARLKLVGTGCGRVEREELVDEVVLVPGDRAVVDALFVGRGEHRLEHRLPGRSLPLAVFDAGPPRGASREAAFADLRADPALARFRARLAEVLERAPDATVATNAVGGQRPRLLHAQGHLPKLRLQGVPTSRRTRQHLVSLEGGRLLVVSRDGAPSRSLAWTDALLLRAGEVVDGLLEAAETVVTLRCRDPEAPRHGGTVLLHVDAPG